MIARTVRVDRTLLVALGAVLLGCAPLLPSGWRVVVLPALLLAPGNALLAALRQDDPGRELTLGVPTSLIMIIFASLSLNAGGIRLGPASLGLTLGAVTAVLLAVSGGSVGRASGGSARDDAVDPGAGEDADVQGAPS